MTQQDTPQIFSIEIVDYLESRFNLITKELEISNSKNRRSSVEGGLEH